MTRLNKQEFWEWAYGNLLTNTTRGVLAEYIVATALGIDDDKRREWANHDLEFGDIGIEVKSAAYAQIWEQTRPSEITFSIRTAHSWDDSSKTRADKAKRSAAVYVFCLLEGEDRDTIDPLDVAHWTFYVMSTSELDRQVRTFGNYLWLAHGVPPCPWHFVQFPNIPWTFPAPLQVEH